MPERGAPMARRDEREYWTYLSEEQRSQRGCPARQLCYESRGRDTRKVSEETRGHVLAGRLRRQILMFFGRSFGMCSRGLGRTRAWTLPYVVRRDEADPALKRHIGPGPL